MLISRALAVLLTVAALGLVACGGDDADDTSGSGSTDTAGERAEGGSDGGVDVCAALSADDVGTALGGTVAVSEIPGGGCNFYDPDEPRAPSLAVSPATLVEGAGGFEGTRTGVTAVVDGEVTDVEGVGDDAFQVIGTGLGSESLTGIGAVLSGDSVVQIQVSQSQGLDAETVEAMLTASLELVGSVL